jgi:outer membrane protein assembly factor BamE (lipoprotein component of BamABCDE complex)
MHSFRIKPVSGLVLSLALIAGALPAAARDNPVDPLSNPNKLEYRDVDARRPDFREPFLRDGVVTQPAVFRQVTAGLAAAQVQSILGQPLRESQGPRGPEWDYNFKFRLPESSNYLVCQYKVVFDEGKKAVRETVWRRKQCLDLVSKATAK